MTPKTWEELVEATAKSALEALCREDPWEAQTNYIRQIWREDIARTLIALRAAGLAIVPREATKAMEFAAEDADYAHWAGAIDAAISAGEIAPPDKGEIIGPRLTPPEGE